MSLAQSWRRRGFSQEHHLLFKHKKERFSSLKGAGFQVTSGHGVARSERLQMDSPGKTASHLVYFP